MRKTVEVLPLLERANHFFLHSEDKRRGERIGMALMISDILHAAGRYAGFHYLRDYEMKLSERGKTVGIIFDSENHNHSYPDDSRVAYSIKLHAHERT